MRAGTRKTISILLCFLGVYLTVRYLMPLFLPFLLGAVLAVSAEPLTQLLCRRLHLPRGVSTGISISMSFCLLFLLMLLAAAFLLRELRVLAGVLPDLEDTARSGLSLLENWLLELTARSPGSLQPLLSSNVKELFSGGTRVLNQAMSWLLGLAGTMLTHVPDSALSLGTMIIAGFMISAKLPQIRQWLKNRIREDRLQAMLRTLERVRRAAGGWLFAQSKLACVTWLLLTLGFLLLQISHAPLWALAVALVDILPVLGTGTVLIPWALISLLQRNTARALGLVGIYLTVTLTRSALEPKLLGRHLGLDPLVTLMAMYAGYKLWGIGGMLLSPLIAVTAIQLVPEKGTPPA